MALLFALVGCGESPTDIGDAPGDAAVSDAQDAAPPTNSGPMADSGPPANATDAGEADAGPADAGTLDAATVDAGAVDASAADSGSMDAAASVDGGATDSGATDSGATDSGATDSGAMDSGAMDSGVVVASGPCVASCAGAEVIGAEDPEGIVDGCANGGAVFTQACDCNGNDQIDEGDGVLEPITRCLIRGPARDVVADEACVFESPCLAGLTIDAGYDTNEDGTLDCEERLPEASICSASTTSLATVADCFYGGTTTLNGYDDGTGEGTAGDGLLHADEVVAERTIHTCSQPGGTSLLEAVAATAEGGESCSTECSSPCCEYGGSVRFYGKDDGAGEGAVDDGVLHAAERDGCEVTCNAPTPPVAQRVLPRLSPSGSVRGNSRAQAPIFAANSQYEMDRENVYMYHAASFAFADGNQTLCLMEQTAFVEMLRLDPSDTDTRVYAAEVNGGLCPYLEVQSQYQMEDAGSYLPELTTWIVEATGDPDALPTNDTAEIETGDEAPTIVVNFWGQKEAAYEPGLPGCCTADTVTNVAGRATIWKLPSDTRPFGVMDVHVTLNGPDSESPDRARYSVLRSRQAASGETQIDFVFGTPSPKVLTSMTRGADNVSGSGTIVAGFASFLSTEQYRFNFRYDEEDLWSSQSCESPPCFLVSLPEPLYFHFDRTDVEETTWKYGLYREDGTRHPVRSSLPIVFDTDNAEETSCGEPEGAPIGFRGECSGLGCRDTCDEDETLASAADHATAHGFDNDGLKKAYAYFNADGRLTKTRVELTTVDAIAGADVLYANGDTTEVLAFVGDAYQVIGVEAIETRDYDDWPVNYRAQDAEEAEFIVDEALESITLTPLSSRAPAQETFEVQLAACASVEAGLKACDVDASAVVHRVVVEPVEYQDLPDGQEFYCVGVDCVEAGGEALSGASQYTYVWDATAHVLTYDGTAVLSTVEQDAISALPLIRVEDAGWLDAGYTVSDAPARYSWSSDGTIATTYQQLRDDGVPVDFLPPIVDFRYEGDGDQPDQYLTFERFGGTFLGGDEKCIHAGVGTLTEDCPTPDWTPCTEIRQSSPDCGLNFADIRTVPTQNVASGTEIRWGGETLYVKALETEERPALVDTNAPETALEDADLTVANALIERVVFSTPPAVCGAAKVSDGILAPGAAGEDSIAASCTSDADAGVGRWQDVLEMAYDYSYSGDGAPDGFCPVGWAGDDICDPCEPGGEADIDCL